MAFTYSWSTIADGAIDPDSPIDTALMTALRNNVVYAYEYTGGKSYTPAEPHTHDGTNSALIATVADGGITEPKLGASAVSQGKLKTSTATYSIVGPQTSPGTTNMVTAAGGQYHLGFSFRLYSAGTLCVASWSESDSDSVNADTGYRARIKLYMESGGSSEFVELQERYVAACPPYNLGNGDIPMFYFGLLNNTTRNIDVLWGAEDPPFANNGPTIINPLGRIRRLVPGTLADDTNRSAHITALKRTHAMVHSNDPKDQAAVRAILDAPVTMEEKLRDMPLIPHPFASNLAGYTVVLLDPCGSVVEDLWLGETYGGDDAHKIIHGGKLIIDNTPCGAIAPPGVMAVGCRWKNTP